MGKQFFMVAPVSDNEFMQYWSKLTTTEKESLLTVARQYVQLKNEDADDIRKQLVMEERASYLKTEDKSFGWDEVKDKLHQYIDVADEQKLQAIYTLLEDEINWSYTKEDIELFHQRRQKHLDGTSKSYTAAESLNAARQQKK